MTVAGRVAGMVTAATIWPAAATSQPYISAEIGYTSADFDLGAPYNGSVDDRGMHYGLDAGFAVTEHFAFEAGVRRYGELDGHASPCPAGRICPLIIVATSGNDITSYNVTAVPHANIGNVQLFGEIGYYYADIETELGLPGDSFDTDGLLLGAGVRWYFDQPWSVSLGASRLDDDLYRIAVGFGWGIQQTRE